MAESPSRTEAGTALTDLVMTVFRLNGDFQEAAEGIASPSGLTAARWQVLAGALDQPHSVADVSRRMGLARQSVQRLADILVSEGFAAYHENPLHRRAKLFAITEEGRAAIRSLAGRQHAWANAISDGMPVERLQACTDTLRLLIERVEAHLRPGLEAGEAAVRMKSFQDGSPR
jgi:DNA-binding MarR family transcriptional regulator